MSGEEKGDAKQEQTADDRRHDGAAIMPLSQAARIARLKAEAEKIRAAQRALDDPDHRRDGRDRLDPAPAGLRGVTPQAQPGTQAVPNAPEAPRDRSPRDPEERTDGRRSCGSGERRQVDPATPSSTQEARGTAATAANRKAEAAVERLKEKLDQRQKEKRPQPETEQEDDPVAEADADAEAASERRDEISRDPETGRFREGHGKLGGRVAGSKDRFPRNSFRAMTDIIAGRVMKNQKDKESGQEVAKSAAEIMAEAIFEGMAGELILHQDPKGGITYANPLHAVKLYHEYMLRAKELKIRVAELKKKEKGASGGIRVVLLNPVADPLLRPGQKPRPLRLLGQDPSKPLLESTGTTTEEPGSSGPVPAQSLAPNPEDTFDPAELIEDFEHPICQVCMGVGWVRDENGIHMVTCDYCEGEGRAPAPE